MGAENECQNLLTAKLWRYRVIERFSADWSSNAVRLSRLPVLMSLKRVVFTPAKPVTYFAYVTGFFLWSCSGSLPPLPRVPHCRPVGVWVWEGGVWLVPSCCWVTRLLPISNHDSFFEKPETTMTHRQILPSSLCVFEFSSGLFLPVVSFVWSLIIKDIFSCFYIITSSLCLFSWGPNAFFEPGRNNFWLQRIVPAMLKAP